MFNFPNALNKIIESIHCFHDYIMRFIIAVALIVLIILYAIINNMNFSRNYKEAQNLEFIWTLTPTIILLTIIGPSLRLLYLREDFVITNQTLKAQGHQWYWQYDYSGATYDSYLSRDEPRLLQGDNRLQLPTRRTQLLVTSADVLHSWTVPSLAVKADAVPGRVNKLTLKPLRPGIFFGQCREICGRNHSFIPISIECYFNYFSFFEKSPIKS